MQRDAPPTPQSVRDAVRSRVAGQPRLIPARWIGILATAAAVVLILLIRQFISISSPGLILLVFVAITGVLAGIAPALVSAAIVVTFVAVDASAPGQPFTYDSAALSRLVVNGSTAVVMALLVGGIQQRLASQNEVVAGQRSEDRQRALTDPASEAILTIDTGSIVTAANPASSELFGYPIDEIVGESITKLMPPAYRGRHFDAFARYLRTGRRTIPWHSAELRALHASGREFPIEVSIGEYGSGPERRFTGIIRDISRRKDIEAQLLQAQKMDAIGRLAGGVAHDFNNLLTAIGGYAELVGSSMEVDDPRQAAIGGIRQATDQAASLTKQLLAFSRSQELRPAVIDLSQVVTNLVPMLRRLLGERVELVVKPTEEPCRTVADRSQIEAILVNLAVNARDAMPDGGTLAIETARVELDAANWLLDSEVVPGAYAGLVVSDTGVGMDATTLSHVFEPFFTTKAPGSGTGLGLATVYGTVKQSGGYIWVYSEPEHGTTFKVYLPSTDEPDAPAPIEEPAPVGSQVPGHETILVAEDEAVVREMVVASLERLGYRVVAASTGEEAVRLIDRLGDEIDLLLSDVVMPGMSGPDLYDRARRTRPDLRAVFMSGYTALSMGRPIPDGITLLEKPFSAARLDQVVRETLSRDA
jgi:two-component system, cell cycle sensor histidine kinase and response regulator CckA